MQKKLSLVRVWVLAGVVFVLAAIFSLSIQGQSHFLNVYIGSLIVGCLAIFFAFGLSIYRLADWAVRGLVVRKGKVK